jgi:hypothetical protein
MNTGDKILSVLLIYVLGVTLTALFMDKDTDNKRGCSILFLWPLWWIVFIVKFTTAAIKELIDYIKE